MTRHTTSAVAAGCGLPMGEGVPDGSVCTAIDASFERTLKSSGLDRMPSRLITTPYRPGCPVCTSAMKQPTPGSERFHEPVIIVMKVAYGSYG